jgi:hypothetical protein
MSNAVRTTCGDTEVLPFLNSAQIKNDRIPTRIPAQTVQGMDNLVSVAPVKVSVQVDHNPIIISLNSQLQGDHQFSP